MLLCVCVCECVLYIYESVCKCVVLVHVRVCMVMSGRAGMGQQLGLCAPLWAMGFGN